jgi:hypothetical protein
MKYILPFGQADRLETSHRLIAELRLAEAAADWSELSRLVESTRSDDFGLVGWRESPGLFESHAEGKALVQQRIEKLAADVKEDDPIETKKKLEDKLLGPGSDFEWIVRELGQRAKYIPAFVRFRLDHRLSRQQLTDLNLKLINYRDQLKDLSMSIDDYSKLPPGPDDRGQTPIERLNDEFTGVDEMRAGGWIVRALPKLARTHDQHTTDRNVNLQARYKESDPETKKRLLTAAARLKSLNRPGLIMMLRLSLSKFSTIEEVIREINKTAQLSDTAIGDALELATSRYPSVAVLAHDDQRVVISFRSDRQLPYLCSGAKTFCIQPKWYNPVGGGSFWTYASGSVQLGILDFSRTMDDAFRTVGVTISPDGTVRSLCDQPNRCISGGDYRQVLLNFTTSNGSHGYPKELIDQVAQNFDTEMRIKKSIDPIYKDLSRVSGAAMDEKSVYRAIIKRIIDTSGDFASLLKKNIGEILDQEQIDLANLILASELADLDKHPELISEFIGMYDPQTSGDTAKILIGKSQIDVFKKVFGNSSALTSGFIKRMVEHHKKVFDIVKKNVEYYRKVYLNGTEEEKKKYAEKYKSVLPHMPKLSIIYDSLLETITSLSALELQLDADKK